MFRLKESRLEKLFQLGPQSKELIPRSEEFHVSDSLLLPKIFENHLLTNVYVRRD